MRFFNLFSERYMLELLVSGLAWSVFFNEKIWGRVLYRGKYVLRQFIVLYKLAAGPGKDA